MYTITKGKNKLSVSMPNMIFSRNRDLHVLGFQSNIKHPSKHAYMGPIWGVQPGSAWVPYGLAHMPFAQMGPI